MRSVNRIILTFLMFFCFVSCDTLQQVSNMPAAGGVTTNSPPSSREIGSGLKQALQIGVDDAVKKVSAMNGFFKDPLIKILFPPEAIKVENTLRQLGFGKLCDQVILSLNRAAEKASKDAAPIFMNALKKMTFNDARNILLGSDTAATHYFKQKTTTELKAKFEPVITASLAQVGATRYWTQVVTQYNRLPLVKPINPNLSDYVTQKAIDGLFTTIAQKEALIRESISERTTPLLKKVFGYAQKHGAGIQ